MRIRKIIDYETATKNSLSKAQQIVDVKNDGMQQAKLRQF